MRILAVDPGEKRLGIALSDPSCTIASPLTIIRHISRQIDSETITKLAIEKEVSLIIVGQALDENNFATPQSRRAERLAQAIRERIEIPVKLWDESSSTEAIHSAQIAMSVSRKKRRGYIDDLAAAYILQTYLDSEIGIIPAQKL